VEGKMKRFHLNSNRFNENEEAVVGVVVAVMLVGLLLAIFLIFQTVFVPDWMEQLESEHLDEVGNQFAMLKYAVDIQSVSQENIPITTSIVLGNKEIPFFTSSRAFGFLRITTEECEINITENASSFYSYKLGIVKYTSSNSYFLDQSYAYEASAIISSQAEGNVMFIKPTFSADYNKIESQVNISFTITNIKASGEKTSVSGFGTYPIRTNFSKISLVNASSIQKITVTTNYVNAWATHINSTLTKQDLDYGSSNDYWVDKNSGNVTVYFNSPPGSPNVDIYMQVVDIYAQIAPGWIEN
jgi:hypothetical protein